MGVLVGKMWCWWGCWWERCRWGKRGVSGGVGVEGGMSMEELVGKKGSWGEEGVLVGV